GPDDSLAAGVGAGGRGRGPSPGLVRGRGRAAHLSAGLFARPHALAGRPGAGLPGPADRRHAWHVIAPFLRSTDTGEDTLSDTGWRDHGFCRRRSGTDRA